MPSIPKTIGEFAVLPVQLPEQPSLALAAPAMHFLYVRRNEPKMPTDDDERSLFLANVPIDATEELLRALFAALVGPGRFESATFEEAQRQKRHHRRVLGNPDASDDDSGADGADGADSDDASDEEPAGGFETLPQTAATLQDYASRKRKREGGGAAATATTALSRTKRNAMAVQRRQATLPPVWPQPLRRSGSTAVALLADAKSTELVFKAIAKVHKTATGPADYPAWPAASADTLGPAWIAGHNRLVYPDHAALLASVDSFFALFNSQEAEARELARRMRNVPDEDGFVTVTRASAGRSAPARQEEAVSARAKQLAKQERQRQEMTSFYRFQLRERKKEEQSEMQRRFVEDQKRVAAMREKRGKFKPEA